MAESTPISQQSILPLQLHPFTQIMDYTFAETPRRGDYPLTRPNPANPCSKLMAFFKSNAVSDAK